MAVEGKAKLSPQTEKAVVSDITDNKVKNQNTDYSTQEIDGCGRLCYDRSANLVDRKYIPVKNSHGTAISERQEIRVS